MKTLEEIKDFENKKIILRTDLDIPVSAEGNILEPFRIQKQKPMVDYLLDRGARVVMVAHISAVDSFELILSQLEKIFGYEIRFINDFETRNWKLEVGNLFLLDNIRRWPGEKENDEDFAKKLADRFDFYINNAFAVCHRNHASISAVTKFLPSYAGLLVEEETSELKKLINAPKDGKLIIIGGAKAETKIPVIKNFLDKSEKIILGGIVANDVFKERGVNIDASIVDENSKELLVGLDIYDERLILADDFNAPGGKILDIGPKTIDKFTGLIKQAKMTIWNGPVGLFENPDYAKGTYEIAKTIAGSSGFRVIGGGDTITAVNKLGLLDQFDSSTGPERGFISTGGGAMLAFLAGEKLPGLEALGYYDK